MSVREMRVSTNVFDGMEITVLKGDDVGEVSDADEGVQEDGLLMCQ